MCARGITGEMEHHVKKWKVVSKITVNFYIKHHAVDNSLDSCCSSSTPVSEGAVVWVVVISLILILILTGILILIGIVCGVLYVRRRRKSDSRKHYK